MLRQYFVSLSRITAGIFLVLLCSCKPKPDTIAIAHIVINAPKKFDKAVKARKTIRAKVREIISEETTVKFVNRKNETTNGLIIKVHSVTLTSSEESVRPIEVRLTRSKPQLKAIGRGTVDGDFVTSVMTGFHHAWSIIRRMRELQVADGKDLVEALGEQDPQIYKFVIQQIGERKIKEAVDPLCTLLKTEEKQDMVLTIVGTLVALEDQKAVESLIDLTRLKNPGFVMQILFAISSIGGRMAEGFLVTLASGHPNPEIQKGAKDALAEMQNSKSMNYK